MLKKRPHSGITPDVSVDTISQFKSLSTDLKNNLPLDVAFTADGEIVKANRMLLSARSPLFRAMLNSDMREASADTIKLSEIDTETLNGVLEWVSSCDYVETIKMAQQKAKKLETKSDSEEERGDDGEAEFYNTTFFKRRQHLKPPGHIIQSATKFDVHRSVTNLLLNILLAANRFDMPDLILT